MVKSNVCGLLRPQYPSMMLSGEINSVYFPLYLSSMITDYLIMKDEIHMTWRVMRFSLALNSMTNAF